MGKFLSIAAGLSFLVTSNSFGTVWPSDGSEANVQAIHDTNAHDGDTITLPAGTFIWTTGVSLTKGITVSGQTTITGAGTANCTANDQTIIIDEKLRGTPGSLLKATIPAGKSFRLTGITFRRGTVNIVGGDGGIRVNSSGGLVQSARIDHCHFYHLAWGAMLQVSGWTYGVDDHNLFEQGTANHSHYITNGATNGHTNGNGSWADFPYYGSEKFWFIEDNTIKGTGISAVSGGIDCISGGRYVARHNYWQNATPNGHGTEGWAVRGMRAVQVYNNTFFWTIPPGGSQRSGSSIWHDNTWLGRNSANGTHTALSYYREYGAAGGDLDELGHMRTARTDGIRTILTAYISVEQRRATQQSATHATFTTGTIHDAERLSRDAGSERSRRIGLLPYSRLPSLVIPPQRLPIIITAAGDRGAPLLFNSRGRIFYPQRVDRAGSEWTWQR